MITLDVGNSSITLGLFRGKRLLAEGRVATGSARVGQEVSTYIGKWVKRFRLKPEDRQVIIASVVPKVTGKLTTALKRSLGKVPWVVGKNIKVPVVNKYRVPSQVGQDRLVNAYAAHTLYGGPAIVVDFGTAITIDLVSKRREYLGGMIVPGLELAFSALAKHAALLPQVKLARPKDLLGRDTVSSMQAGVIFGYSSLCDGMVERIRRASRGRPHVVATGGQAALVARYCKRIQTVNPNLTLQGLQFLAALR